jgi:hypothetical protein
MHCKEDAVRTRYYAAIWLLLLVYVEVFGFTVRIEKEGTGSGQVKINGTLYSLPYSGNFSFMSNLKMEAVPDDYSYFWGWKELNSSLNPFSMPVMSSLTITAVLYRNALSILKSSDGIGDGQVKVNGVIFNLPYYAGYKDGAMFTVQGVPNSASQFAFWYTNYYYHMYDNPFTLTCNRGTVFAYISFDLKTEIEGDKRREAMPRGVRLEQNYPNPFNTETCICFDLAGAGRARLVVSDIQGRELQKLVDGTISAGSHEVTFDAAGLTSGVYFYHLAVTGDDGHAYQVTRKFMLIR